MKRTLALRCLALVVLLLHGGAFAAANVLDGRIAARANAAASHVESASGLDCAGHDEGNCLLCRVGAMAGWAAQRPVSCLAAARKVVFAPAHAGERATSVAGALRARAPPLA